MFILRSAKALAALSCSGGVFLHLYKTKITYLPKALLRHFSRDLESPPLSSIYLYRYFYSSIFVYDLTPV